MDIQSLIKERSLTIKDPAARTVPILKDRDILDIAEAFRVTVPEVYEETLKLGICPYRYIRNRDAISPQEQLRLAQSGVTVVGAGGLGGHVLLLLARIGIGRLVAVDHDVFDETNLNRQVLSNGAALGRSKAAEAQAAIAAVNPGVKVIPFRVKMDPSNTRSFLEGSHVAVDALDNVQDRFVLEKAAKDAGIPLVHGALAGFEGRVMTIFPEDPGLVHLYGDDTASVEASARPEAVLGVPTLTPAVIAALQAMEVVKILLKRGRILRNTMTHLDLEMGELHSFVFEEAEAQGK